MAVVPSPQVQVPPLSPLSRHSLVQEETAGELEKKPLTTLLVIWSQMVIVAITFFSCLYVCLQCTGSYHFICLTTHVASLQLFNCDIVNYFQLCSSTVDSYTDSYNLYHNHFIAYNEYLCTYIGLNTVLCILTCYIY